MKITALRELGQKDLQSKLVELSKGLLKQRAQVATGAAPKSVGQIRQAKRTIARIKTILVERGTENKS